MERRYRLRLINPRSPLTTIALPGVIQKMTFSRRGLFMPLNLAICAAVAPDHWEPEIIDENILDDLHVPSAEGVDAVGIGAMTAQAKRAYELADAYRALGVPVILGGIHPSVLTDEALQHADFVCRGDAESTLGPALEAVEAWREGPGAPADSSALPPQDRKGGDRPQSPRVFDWRNYGEQPIATPRKDLLNPKDYLVFNPIQTTRGCPHRCTFCSTPAVFGNRFRQRDIGAIVEEMRRARDEQGSRFFIFSDDNVAGSPRWALDLFEAIRPLGVRWASQCDVLIGRDPRLLRAMKDSGCMGVIIGLESPKGATLREAGKRHARAEEYALRIQQIQAAGISIWGSFIFGFDTDDWRDCMGAVRFSQRVGLSMSLYTILTPYPGTELFNRYEADGRILTRDWEKYNGASVVYRPQRMTEDQLRHAQQAAFSEFYSLPSTIRRLKAFPLKPKSWLANLAIHRGMAYYYSSHNRPMPRFADNL